MDERTKMTVSQLNTFQAHKPADETLACDCETCAFVVEWMEAFRRLMDRMIAERN